MSASDHNISTDHQPPGSARNPADTLDRTGDRVPAGQRQFAHDSDAPPAPNADAAAEAADPLQTASVRKGGEASGGLTPQADDPTDPARAAAHAQERDAAMAERGFGDDGPRSTYRS